MIEITEVKMTKVFNIARLKAIASITINNCFVVNDIKLMEGQKGLYIVMPSRRLPSGEFKDVAHPINADTRELIQRTIIEKYINMD